MPSICYAPSIQAQAQSAGARASCRPDNNPLRDNLLGALSGKLSTCAAQASSHVVDSAPSLAARLLGAILLKSFAGHAREDAMLGIDPDLCTAIHRLWDPPHPGGGADEP
jgi:hypothetical protein